jgi:hypothetical protein
MSNDKWKIGSKNTPRYPKIAGRITVQTQPRRAAPQQQRTISLYSLLKSYKAGRIPVTRRNWILSLELANAANGVAAYGFCHVDRI